MIDDKWLELHFYRFDMKNVDKYLVGSKVALKHAWEMFRNGHFQGDLRSKNNIFPLKRPRESAVEAHFPTLLFF